MSKNIAVLQRIKGLLFFLIVAGFATVSWAADAPRQVLAFYYPWYGIATGPGGAGRTVHWGRINAAGKDIEASTDYPELGAYDSHDPNVIDQHCRWAKEAGIDGFIVSWWGHNHYTDRAMSLILDACKRHGLNACIYYETVPRPKTPRAAADDIVKVLNKYGKHPAHLKVDGKPVVFVYGRALQEMGLTEWLKALDMINAEYKGGVAAIGDQFSFGAVRVFDGVHTYNTAGQLRGREPSDADRWAAETYLSWVRLADAAGKICAITVIPGYDDTKIRKPGLAVQRYDGQLYRVQWEEAIKADPQWILITSFNEWHEGSEIEPSLQYGRRYIDLTTEYASRFKANKNPHKSVSPPSGDVLSRLEKQQLRDKLKGLTLAVLPGADSMGFWWLLDMGVKTELLSWDNVVAGDLTPQRYPLLLYCGSEHYRRTVRRSGDVDDALVAYLRSGGFLVVLPGMPWPFYYDEDGRAVNRSSQFGVALRMGWERPPEGLEPRFVQPKRSLEHVPEQFAFPTSGDLRWRPFVAQAGVEYTSLLQLRDASGGDLGDAVAYAEPKTGGKVLYVCFNLLDGPHAEGLLYDVFDFVAARIDK
jgi:glycoprotein endo-alpha-1,2-mannosidase